MDLFTPDQIRRLPFDQEIIFNHGMNPYIAKKIIFFKDKRFIQKMKIKPLTRDKMLAQLPQQGPYNIWHHLCCDWLEQNESDNQVGNNDDKKNTVIIKNSVEIKENEREVPSSSDIGGFI